MNSQKCENHQWRQYGYGKRTDYPGQTKGFYECTVCNKLKEEIK
jgi:hypothetical protein